MTDGTDDPLLVAEPIVGWKIATIVSDQPHACFQPHLATRTYGVEAQARCDRWAAAKVFQRRVSAIPVEALSDHDAPHEKCACGFYAYRDTQKVSQLSHASGRVSAVLRVHLSGRVIEHEHGWRAQRQEIVAAWVPDCMRRFADCLPVRTYPLTDFRPWNDFLDLIDEGLPYWRCGACACRPVLR